MWILGLGTFILTIRIQPQVPPGARRGEENVVNKPHVGLAPPPITLVHFSAGRQA